MPVLLVLNRVRPQSVADPIPPAMETEHPFQMLFETLGRVPMAHAESVNRDAKEQLTRLVEVPLNREGRCILLRAPRAGHGKTHLLSRVQHQYRNSHEFIPLRASCGYQIDAATTLEDVLRYFLDVGPDGGGRSLLDEVTRRMFSAALQPLVASGEVPSQDKEGALSALRERPVETFNFHDPGAVTAQWTAENFDVLGERLGVELAKECGLPIREVAFWVSTLFKYAAAPVEHPNRLRDLMLAVDPKGGDEVVAMARLEALLGLVALLRRVVLVADELEGFSSDNNAALRLATFVGSLRQSVAKVDVIISLNRDVWESVFVPCLSGGLADRLSEHVVELQGLGEDQMVALLESRVPGMGPSILGRLDRAAAGTHARGLIKEAGLVWQQARVSEKVEIAPVPKLVDVRPSAMPVMVAAKPATPEMQPAVAAGNDQKQIKEVSEPSQVEPEATKPAPDAEPAESYGFVDEEIDEHPSEKESEMDGKKVTDDESESTDGEEVIGDAERMDELLKKFRERFGQSGL